MQSWQRYLPFSRSGKKALFPMIQGKVAKMKRRTRFTLKTDRLRVKGIKQKPQFYYIVVFVLFIAN